MPTIDFLMVARDFREYETGAVDFIDAGAVYEAYKFPMMFSGLAFAYRMRTIPHVDSGLCCVSFDMRDPNGQSTEGEQPPRIVRRITLSDDDTPVLESTSALYIERTISPTFHEPGLHTLVLFLNDVAAAAVPVQIDQGELSEWDMDRYSYQRADRFSRLDQQLIQQHADVSRPHRIEFRPGRASSVMTVYGG